MCDTPDGAFHFHAIKSKLAKSRKFFNRLSEKSYGYEDKIELVHSNYYRAWFERREKLKAEQKRLGERRI